ncbi:hypothetical protein AKJ08_1998 [Vulgatibacter incomptus]|uniref:Uncharacterized protein n=1 Tax=Vulgatibacter incomptus TaxID=1391653 RepID=A0A0K1PDW3_9BACT|nr:hypothetical protein AKJ08_1998 [Vulgatibacter incomptus]
MRMTRSGECGPSVPGSLARRCAASSDSAPPSRWPSGSRSSIPPTRSSTRAAHTATDGVSAGGSPGRTSPAWSGALAGRRPIPDSRASPSRWRPPRRSPTPARRA